MIQLATDDFHRADANPISGPWSSAGNVQILGDVASAATTSSTTIEVAINTAVTWPADQYSEITGGVFTDTGLYIGPSVRMDAGKNGYAFLYTAGASQTAFLQKYAGSGGATLASGAFTILATDVIRLSVVGSTLTVTQNGTVILTATDVTYTTGSAGIAFYASSSFTNTIGLWAGGGPGGGGPAAVPTVVCIME